MIITCIGYGQVGGALAAPLPRAGHEVILATTPTGQHPLLHNFTPAGKEVWT